MSALDEDSWKGEPPSHIRYKESLRKNVIKYLPQILVVDCPASGSWRETAKCLVCEYYKGHEIGFIGNTVQCGYTI